MPWVTLTRPGMTRKLTVIVVAAAAIGFFLVWTTIREPGPSVPSRSSPPNILVYMIDTLRSDDLGAYGSVDSQTPAIDAFSAESTLFENARTPSPSTRPAVASLVTGLPPMVHGIAENRGGLAEEFVRLPELLGAEGYYTGALIANPNVRPQTGFDKGFGLFRNLLPESWQWAADADWVADEVRQFIENVPADTPFFLFVLSIDPHQPYQPPSPYDTIYDQRAADREAGSGANLYRIDTLLESGEEVSTDEMSSIRALYRGEIAYADKVFGDLLDWMQDRDLLDETLVVLTSDHGEAFGEHGNRGHSKTIYEETMRIPMILRHPGMFPAGERRTGNADLLDLTATLAAAGGADKPHYWTGTDLREPVTGKNRFSMNLHRSGEQVTFYASITRGRHKLISNEPGGVTEFYDLVTDPLERSPLNNNSNQQDITAMMTALQRYQNSNLELRRSILNGDIALPAEEMSEDIRQRLESLGYIQ